MKKEVSKNNASRLLNCGMVILVTCAYKDKKNITPCAWHMPVSKSPSAMAVALAQQHFSSELIKKSGSFIINVPGWPLLDKVIACGSSSGWKVDKFKQTGLTPAKAYALAAIPKINECLGCIECAVIDVKEVGDHSIFLGEVLFAEAESEYFRENMWDTAGVDLIFHLGSRFFFKSDKYVEVKQ